MARSEDRHGNGVTLAYGSGANISSISDDTGRQVLFSWDTAASPNRLTSLSDWATIDANGVVQTSAASGSRRSYRFFYDPSARLAGWSDPLNTSGSCPAGGSHLTCIAYPTGKLTISKTQTVETISGSPAVLGTASRPITTEVAFAGSRASMVTDAEQQSRGLSAERTSFSADWADRVVVRRPTTTTNYELPMSGDTHARVASE